MGKRIYGIFYIAVILSFSMVFSYTYVKLNSKNSIFVEHISIDDVPPTVYKTGEDEGTEIEEPTTPTETPLPTNVPVPTRTPVPISTPVPTSTPVAPVVTATPNVNPSVKNYTEENNKLANKIFSEYGINIRYGNGIKDYTVSEMRVTPITKEEDINKYLNDIYNNLKLYPNGMFKEVSDYGFRLSFYMVTRFSIENVAGVTEQKGLNVIISVATDYDFKETLNHELYHYFDSYMDIKGNTHDSWKTLNPAEFIYGKTNNSYSFFSTYKANSYFINDYAQTDDYEDRAVTFEYMMADYELKCFERGTPIYKKARLISDTLDTYFNSVSINNNEYWERYIN